MTDRDDKVRERAYQLWQEGGEAHGSDQDHWHRAEAEFAPPPADGEAVPGETSDAPATPTDDVEQAAPPASTKPRGRRKAVSPAEQTAEAILPPADGEPAPATKPARGRKR